MIFAFFWISVDAFKDSWYSVLVIFFSLIFDSTFKDIKDARKNNVQEEVESDWEVNNEYDGVDPTDIICRQHNIRKVGCC